MILTGRIFITYFTLSMTSFQAISSFINVPTRNDVINNNQYQRLTNPLNAGGGFGSSSTSKQKGKKGSSPKSNNNSSAKKKIQIKEKVLKQYGGDIAKGTEERIQNAMLAQPPYIQQMADLYKKIVRWDSSIATMTLMQQSQLPQRDIDGAKRARGELDALYEQYGVGEEDMHNLFQRITWDASADAKAAKASIGEMPNHIRVRVDRACSIIAECVKRAGRKEGRCLDVGCGHGTLIPNLTNAGIYPGQIVGVDLSSEMIRNAEERYRGPQFIATDFLQFNDDKLFDGVIFCSSLHDLPDMQSCIAKAAALLRPEGKLVIIHAQGGGHVDSQNKANPLLVKRGLPSSDELSQWSKEMMIELDILPALPFSKEDDDEGYLAVLRKKP